MQKQGLRWGECADEWNLRRPQTVADLARSFVDAGCELILTNTFRANRAALEQYGLAKRVREINTAGVRLSIRAAEGRARVFGSIGPAGTAERSIFEEQAIALAEAGADGLVVETMTDIDEACAAVEGASSTGLPVVGCVTANLPGESRIGESLRQAGASVIGTNCVPVREAAAACTLLRAATSLPVWIKASLGFPEMVDGRPVYAMTPDAFASEAAKLAACGASYIGGCCGAGPEHIRAFKALL